jgi:predicted RNA polymerase sigma factor
VMALPTAQRQALIMREYQGLSYGEIAELLGVSRGAAESLLFRARQGFRATYEGLAVRPAPPGCAELAPLLSRMLDEELSMAAWQPLTEHLEECAHCRAELQGLGRTRQLPTLFPLARAAR